MALETGTYINALVASNPVDASDQVASVGGHLRLLKSAIKATFPNVTGAVTVTQLELNHLAGVTSPIQTQLGTKAASGANGDITSLTGLTTPLSVAQGGTGAASNAAAPYALKGANTDITSLNAPALGAATATTQAASNDSTKVATTAFVMGEMDATHLVLGVIAQASYPGGLDINPGQVVNGSIIRVAGFSSSALGSGATVYPHADADFLTGTWECLGRCSAAAAFSYSLFKRVT